MNTCQLINFLFPFTEGGGENSKYNRRTTSAAISSDQHWRISPIAFRMSKKNETLAAFLIRRELHPSSLEIGKSK